MAGRSKIVGVIALAFFSFSFAQTQYSSLSSDDLMKRIVELGGDGNKQAEFAGYMQELIDRAKAQNPSALFNYGWYRLQICKTFKKQASNVSNAPMCTQALSDLTSVAENPKIRVLFISPASMRMLGEMYRDGIGTQPSRYLAADWFVRAAKQLQENGSREAAIRALEDALNAVPDHPAALVLRTDLIK